MRRAIVVLAGALAWGLVGNAGTSALAAPPQIKNIVPAGARRGTATEVTISGAALTGGPRLIAPFEFKLEGPALKNDAATWQFKLVVDAETAVGVYPVRIQTDDGVSGPFLLAVGQFPTVAEKEDNSTFETAQALPAPPLVVEGSGSGNDVDFFKFPGRKGQRIVVDAQCARIGSGLDPTVRLTTAAKRAYVASADDTPGLVTDARFTAVLPEDGDYVVEISDSRYQGSSRPVYRLLIGEVPMPAEIFPLGGRAGETIGLELRGGTIDGVRAAAARVGAPAGLALFQPRLTECLMGRHAPAGRNLDLESVAPLVVSSVPELREPAAADAPPVRAAAPVVFNGRIDPADDEDRFALAVVPGERLRIHVEASTLGSALDGLLRVEGNKGAVIANADDRTVPLPKAANNQPRSMVLPDPAVDVTVPAGTNEIALVLRDLERRGGVGFPYRIVVEPLAPDFELHAEAPQLSVPRGGTATLGLTVVRRGHNGPITVTVADPPAGLTVRPATVPEGQLVGAVSLSCAPDAKFPAAPVRLVGRGEQAGAPIERSSSELLIFAEESNLPTNTIEQHGLVVAPALATPVSVDAPAAPIEIAHGFGATVPIKVVRPKGAEGELAIAALPLPTGITVPGDKIAAKAIEGAVRVQAAVNAALGATTIGLKASGKIQNNAVALGVPAVTLNVVRPATVEFGDLNSVNIKPGATFELKGKVVRKGGFNDPVTIKLNGLPAGLKAEAVTVKPGVDDFALKISAEPKTAAPSTTLVKAAVAYQVQKKDYPVPPVSFAVHVVPAK